MSSAEVEKNKVLVVDDSQTQLNIISRIIGNEYVFETCNSPISALDKIKTQNFKILITDLHMDDMTGIELISEAHRVTNCLYSILITAKGTKENAISALKEGANDYIEKPFNQFVLMNALDRADKNINIQLQNAQLIIELNSLTAKLMLRQDDLEEIVDLRTIDLLIAKEQAESAKSALDQHSLVSIADIEGNILYVNDKFVEISGFKKSELLGKKHSVLNSNNQPKSYWQKMHETVLAGKAWRDEVRNRAKDGHYYWVDTTIVPNYDRNKQVTGFTSIRTDITQQKESIANLATAKRQAELDAKELLVAKEMAEQANQAKSVFLANMSHELRTPMHGILSFAEFGAQHFETVERSKLLHYFNRITQSAERLLTLLNQLLDLSKLEQPNEQPNMDIHDIFIIGTSVLTANSALIHRRNISIYCLHRNEKILIPISENVQSKDIFNFIERPAGFGNVEVNADMIFRVIKNVILNAIKYSPENSSFCYQVGETTIELDGKQVPALELSLSDQGVGIPENELKSVFNKFKQSSITNTGAGGTGLGLAICKEIILLHRGKIFARRNTDVGTTFTIILPRKQSAKR